MTDHTSDDLLNQPEPPVEGEVIPDDPVVNQAVSKSLAEHFAQQAQPAALAAPPAPGSPTAPAPARPQTEVPSIAEFVGSTPASINPLEEELRQVKKELALLKMAPAERYPEVLSEAEIDIEEAHQILDCIIVQLKPWVEKIHVVRNLYVVLQTRGHHDQRRLDRWAEETRPQLDTTVVAEALMNNMAASLVAYGDTQFEGETEEERYKAAYAFLEKMPYPAHRMLQATLAKFDAKINTVFSEGYLENF